MLGGQPQELLVLDDIRAGFRRLTRHLGGSPDDAFLKSVGGVIHVGANEGQEREQYDKLGLRVIWVEPIPDVFQKLQANIARFPRQKAVQALLTDIAGKAYDFHISNNSGVSSSILELELHKDIWPDVTYTDKISLCSTTLSDLIKDQAIDIRDYQALVMDTQGSELLVLKGAEDLMVNFKFVKTEVPDFEAYKGCCVLDEMKSYLEGFGFREIHRNKFAEREAGGSYYDVVYGR
ncbi:MAG: hypothetical protein CTY15_07455 [Methylocystis sp.]|nr:MAG: hypothetical protein CTY15_07455 [Methylocystis sp.]